MNKLKTFLLAALLTFSTSGAALAADVSMGAWRASGSEVWRTSFPLYHKETNSYSEGASELIYPHSGTYMLVGYETPIKARQKLRIEGGLMGSLNNAVGSDSDWDYGNSNMLWYYGEFKAGGNSGFINIDIVKSLSKSTEYFYGYGYRINHFRMTDGLYLIDKYKYEPYALDNLDSYYTTIYQGPHVGVNSQTSLSSKLSVIGTVSYSPIAIARGHGWWNLRNLDFKHQAPAKMFDADIGLRLKPDANSAITIGYRFQHLNIYKGWENLSSAITWEKATNVQKGFYITGMKTF